MLCHHYKCVFIHIPKNAGMSIEHVFLKLLDLSWENRAPLLLRYNNRPELGPPRLAHLKATEYVRYKYMPQDMFESYFKFSFVRNPWSRVVSFYKYLGYDSEYDFKTFLFREFKNNLTTEKYWFICPQTEFLFNDNGELLVDYVGRFEQLQDSFDFVCKRIGLSPVQIPHINSSPLKKAPKFSLNPIKFATSIKKNRRYRSIPRYNTYQNYYDLECRDFVAQYYSSDIANFNYTFE